MTASDRALEYANEVFAEMIKAFRRKNRLAFAALYVLHQQAVNTYHILAARAHREKQQRWREAA